MSPILAAMVAQPTAAPLDIEESALRRFRRKVDRVSRPLCDPELAALDSGDFFSRKIREMQDG